ncbi:MAG: primosomal protein DnaI [Bacilli bacterium]|nr:primosomal protein DnaI [Bacilli bacterium]
METLKEIIKDSKYGTSNYKLEKSYQENYDNNITFRKICNKLELPTDTLKKYTTKLEISSEELNNCKNCKNIMECKNEVSGYVYFPEKNGEDIEFAYIPCKYKKELDDKNKILDNIYYFNINKDIKNASMKEIDTKDKNRFEVIKWINDYLKEMKKGNYHKGLYLSGNFGCGKTYLISAMLNEIAKSGKRVAIIYYPEFLRSLKESFYDSEEYKRKFNMIKKTEYILLDDIGADSVTEWSRDEVLGTILQYRMEERLPTFFTSNLTIEELENHLSLTSKDVDQVKARRIIERIKQLTDNLIMISENKRK